MTVEALYCASCGRPTAAPASAPSPATPPPFPSSPPAAPGAGQPPSAATAALTRLLKGDWIGPARIAALPAALLLLLSLILASTAEDVPFGDAFPTALAVVLSALGARPGIELAEQGSPLASLELSFVPLGVTLLWAAALWFGGRIYLRGAAAAGKHLDTGESLLLGVRSVLSAVLGSLLLAWAAGTSVAPAQSDTSDTSAPYLARLMHLPDIALSVTCSPLRAAGWTLVLASVVLFPTLCQTSMSAWTVRRPGLGDWLRAARGAVLALAVPVALAGVVGVVFLVSEGGFSALIPAVLLAPNLGTALLTLGSGASVDFTNTLVMTDSSSSDPGGDGSDIAVSLFDLHQLGGWVWLSVLLGVVAAVVLGAGVLRESARPAAALRALVCFVAGFLLLAVITGIAVELSTSFDDGSSLAYVFAMVLDISPTDGGALAVGPSVPGVLPAAMVWAALGAFGVPALARRLGIARIEDVLGFSAVRERLRGRRTSAPTAVPVAFTAPAPAHAPTVAPAPVPVPVPSVVPAAVAPPLEPPVPSAPVTEPEAAPAESAPADGAGSAPSTEETADKAVAAPVTEPAGSTAPTDESGPAEDEPTEEADPVGESTATAANPTEEAAPAGPATETAASAAEPAGEPAGELAGESAGESTATADEQAEPAAEATEPADEPATSAEEPAEPTQEPAASPDTVAASADEPAEPTDEPAASVNKASASADEPAAEADEVAIPVDPSAGPAPTAVGAPADAPTVTSDAGQGHRAEEAGTETAPTPAAAPPAPPAAPAFANLPTGSMPHPGVAHPALQAPAHPAVHASVPVPHGVHAPAPYAVHAPMPQVVHAPVPQPARRKIGWGVVVVTLVASAVVAGGVTAAGVWLTSDRSAPSSHTTRATEDAVAPGAGAPSTSSTPAPAAPVDPSTVPSGSDVSPSASQLSPEDIANQVQSLLGESALQRGRVSKAITTGRSCSNGSRPVRDAQKDLIKVAGKRDDLARQVDLLAPQADGDLAEALGDLSRAWSASADADRGYASWVSQTADWIDEYGVTACGHGETRTLADLPKDHDDEANEAKRDFATLWNPIALRYGLTEVEADSI
ncbi:hypothetical protein [Streptomyces aureus]|uniref:hypothetical protein n=1 Tax=Streptomyces aureus TaxID=193461 RepID=UPI0033DA1369